MQKEKVVKRNEERLWDLRDTIKRNNHWSFRRRERERKGYKVYINSDENFPNLGRDLDIQVHEANRSPQIFNAKPSSSRQIIIKLYKIKDEKRIFKATREKSLY